MFLALLQVARRTADSLLRSADNRVLSRKRGRYLKKTLSFFRVFVGWEVKPPKLQRPKKQYSLGTHPKYLKTAHSQVIHLLFKLMYCGFTLIVSFLTATRIF